MITLEEVIAIHHLLIEEFGGEEGIRDAGLIEAAIQRPFATFDGKDLYPTPLEKAAGILESFVNNHPFIDGNKRIGYVLMRLTLMNFGLEAVSKVAIAPFSTIIIWFFYFFREGCKATLPKKIEKPNYFCRKRSDSDF